MKTLPIAAAAVLLGSLLTAMPAAFAQAPDRGAEVVAASAASSAALGQAPDDVQSQAPGGAAEPAARPRAEAPVRPPKMPYGMPIRLAQAKRVAAAAEAAAIRANVKVAIAITDNNGELVYFEQLDDTSTGIRELAIQKARFSARFRMPTSYVGAMKRLGNDVFSAFPGAFPGGGGVTLTFDGYTIGGLGVSGGADGQVADAGAAALTELERAVTDGQRGAGAPLADANAAASGSGANAAASGSGAGAAASGSDAGAGTGASGSNPGAGGQADQRGTGFP